MEQSAQHDFIESRDQQSLTCTSRNRELIRCLNPNALPVSTGKVSALCNDGRGHWHFPAKRLGQARTSKCNTGTETF